MRTVIKFFSVYFIVAIAIILYGYNFHGFMGFISFIFFVLIIGSLIRLIIPITADNDANKNINNHLLVSKCIKYVWSAFIVCFLLIVFNANTENKYSEGDDSESATPICNGRGCD